MVECKLIQFKDIIDKFNDLVMHGTTAKTFTIARQCPKKPDQLFLYFTGKYFTYGKTLSNDNALILRVEKDNSIELKECKIVEPSGLQEFPDFEDSIHAELMFVSEEKVVDDEDHDYNRDQTYVNPSYEIT